MSKKVEIQWLKEPEEHNYPAAESYLSLHYDPASAKALADKLKSAPLAQFKAKDIFRASGLSLLGVSGPIPGQLSLFGVSGPAPAGRRCLR